MELKDAKDVTKLVKTAVRTMVNDYKAQRALVIVSESKVEEPIPVAFYGFESDAIWNDPTLPKEVLRNALDNEKPSFVLDARKDNKIRSKRCHRSIVCVPLGKGISNLNGLLFCDHEDPGALDHVIKREMDQLGKDFDARYKQLNAVPKKERIARQAEVDYEGDAAKILRSIKWTALFLTICTIIVLYVSQ